MNTYISKCESKCEQMLKVKLQHGKLGMCIVRTVHIVCTVVSQRETVSEDDSLPGLINDSDSDDDSILCLKDDSDSDDDPGVTILHVH